MFIQFFKNNSPASYILLPLFALVLWLPGFFSAQNMVVQNSMPLYEVLENSFAGIPVIATILAFILIVLEAFLLNYIINENEVLSSPTFLPALFYIVYMSNDNAKLLLNPMIFANLFILLALFKLVSSYRKNIAFSHAFDAGLLFSIATLFYLPSIVFLPILGVGLLIFRPFNWREWVISFFGVLVPILFVLMYYFWYDLMEYLVYDKLFYSIFREQPKIEYPVSYYFMIGVGWFIAMLSLGKLFKRLTGASQKTKKGILLFIWVFVFAVISVLIAPGISTKYLSFLAIPASVFCANYMLRIKKQWWGEFLFLLLLTAITVNHFFN
jgi:Family of unknown function (DUF6427)